MIDFKRLVSVIQHPNHLSAIAMKIFRLICILSKPLGIVDKFNLNVVVAFSLLACHTLFSCAYFLFQAEILAELIDSFYICATTIAYLSYFMTFLWKKTEIFKFIDDFDKFIAKRKFLILFKSIHNR